MARSVGIDRAMVVATAAELAEDAAVLTLAEAYRAYAVAHPGRYAIGLRAPAAADREWAAITERGVEILLAVLAPYGLSDADALYAVRGLRSILHGFATLESFGSFGMPFDRDESFRRLIRAYIAGLRAT